MAPVCAIAVLLVAGARGARPALDFEGASLNVEDSGGGIGQAREQKGCADVPGAEAFMFGSCRCAAEGAELTGEDPACSLEEGDHAFLPDDVEGKGCSCGVNGASSGAGDAGFVEMVNSEPRCPILAEVASMDECKEATSILRLDQGPILDKHSRRMSFCSALELGYTETRWNPLPPTAKGVSFTFNTRPICRTSSYYLLERAVEERGCPEGHEVLSAEECRAALSLMVGRRVIRYRAQPAKAWGCYLEEFAEYLHTDQELTRVEEAVFAYQDVSSQNDALSSDLFNWASLKGSVCRRHNSTAIAEQAVAILSQPWINAELIINSVRRLSATGPKGANRSEALVLFLEHKDIENGSAKQVTDNETLYERECEAIGMVPSWEQHKGLKGNIRSISTDNEKAELASAVGDVHVPIRALHGLERWQPWRVTEATLGAFGIFFGDKFMDPDGIRDAIDKVLGKHLDQQDLAQVLHVGSSSHDMSVRAGAQELLRILAAKEKLVQEAAAKEMQMSLREEKEREIERNISVNITRQVDKPVFFNSDHVLRVPPGIMLLSTTLDEVQGHRCPNIQACPGFDLTLDNFSSTTFNGSCEEGYSANVPGCAGCSPPKSGRSSTDVFACKACGDRFTEALRHLLLPLALFLSGMKSAYDPSGAECFGSVLTVFLSFHSSASLILSAIAASPIGLKLTKNVSPLLSFCIGSAEEASGMPSGSIDCLLGRPAGITLWFLYDAAVPVTILMLWMVGAVALDYIRGGRPNYIVIFVRPMAVFVKSFLPMIFIGVWRAWPCFHTQADTGSFRDLMMYEVDAPCPVLFSWSPDLGLVLCLFGALLCCMLGPGFWLHITLRPAAWGAGPREAVWGVLNRPYKEKREYWEVVALARRMLLASVAVVCPISYSPNTHLKAVLMINVLALGAHAKAWPYKTEITKGMPRHLTMNNIEFLSLITSCVSTILVSYLNEESWTHKQSIDLAVMGSSIVLILAFSTVLSGLLLYTGANKLLAQGELSTGRAAGGSEAASAPAAAAG